MATQWTRYIYNASPTYFKFLVCYLKGSPICSQNTAELINFYNAKYYFRSCKFVDLGGVIELN